MELLMILRSRKIKLDILCDWTVSDQYSDVIMSTMASEITSLMIVYSTVYSGADQRKHQSSASLAFVRGIHRWPVNSPHKGPVTRNIFLFDDVIMHSSVQYGAQFMGQNPTYNAQYTALAIITCHYKA